MGLGKGHVVQARVRAAWKSSCHQTPNSPKRYREQRGLSRRPLPQSLRPLGRWESLPTVLTLVLRQPGWRKTEPTVSPETILQVWTFAAQGTCSVSPPGAHSPSLSTRRTPSCTHPLQRLGSL